MSSNSSLGVTHPNPIPTSHSAPTDQTNPTTATASDLAQATFSGIKQTGNKAYSNIKQISSTLRSPAVKDAPLILQVITFIASFILMIFIKQQRNATKPLVAMVAVGTGANLLLFPKTPLQAQIIVNLQSSLEHATQNNRLAAATKVKLEGELDTVKKSLDALQQQLKITQDELKNALGLAKEATAVIQFLEEQIKLLKARIESSNGQVQSLKSQLRKQGGQ